MRSIPCSLWVVTTLLFINAALAGAGVLPGVVQAISLSGLLLVPWVVVRVLKDQSIQVRELAEGEEWGYQDRPDLRPGA